MAVKKIIKLDFDSLTNFIKSSEFLRLSDVRVANAAKLEVVFKNEFIEAYLARLQSIGIQDIEQLENALGERLLFLEQFAIAWFSGLGAPTSRFIPAGIAISFLSWTVILERGGVLALTEFLREHAFDKGRDVDELAWNLNAVYEDARKEEKSIGSRA